MRDAFGGVFMIRLYMVFIVIYVAFSAISLNYAKAFRLKNRVISIIEENEITDISVFNTVGSSAYKKLDAAIANANYEKECPSNFDNDHTITDETGAITTFCYKGVVIHKRTKQSGNGSIQSSNNKEVIYDVYTFGGWDVQSLNMILELGGTSQDTEDTIHGNWVIKGEARVKLRHS